MIYDSPWFRRTWCVQEIRLSKSAVCHWGQEELPWPHIGTAATWLQDWHARHSFLPDTFPLEVDYESAVEIYDPEWVRKPLVETLSMYRGLLATDARDKVYGLLNLVEQGPLLDSISIDYEKDVKLVYADTTLQIIRQSSTLDILAYVDHEDGYTGDHAFHSWAPEWNKANRTMPLHAHLDTCDTELGTTDEIGPDCDNLQLEGRLLGQITSIDMLLDDVAMAESAAPGISTPFLTL